MSISWLTKCSIIFHGYISLFRCLSVLEDLPTNNDDQRKGVNIVQYALRQPTMKIAENAGAGK